MHDEVNMQQYHTISRNSFFRVCVEVLEIQLSDIPACELLR